MALTDPGSSEQSRFPHSDSSAFGIGYLILVRPRITSVSETSWEKEKERIRTEGGRFG